MYETQVTVVGNLVTEVDKHRLSDGSAVANFRVGSTERRFDRAGGTWVDGNRLYIDVRCRRDLAENSVASLVKGDPVVVTGHIYTRSYEHHGQRRSTPTLEAHSVAADLARCTVVLTRTRRGAAVAERLLAAVPNDDSAEAPTDPPTEPLADDVDAADAGSRHLVSVAPGDEG
jgi:single-strand DNA-binding protein